MEPRAKTYRLSHFFRKRTLNKEIAKNHIITLRNYFDFANISFFGVYCWRKLKTIAYCIQANECVVFQQNWHKRGLVQRNSPPSRVLVHREMEKLVSDDKE